MKLFDFCAHPARIHGCLIEAPLQGVFIGEICFIERSLTQPDIIARAQVVGFKEGLTVLSLIGRAQGLTREVVIRPSGYPFVFEVGEHLAGKIFNAAGEQVGALSEDISEPMLLNTKLLRIDSPPASVTQRRPVSEPMVTGVRAIDSLLTCGLGQRIGIFAAAGSGKTSLMNMIINHAHADIHVVALIGERGREVIEFIEELKESPHAGQTILIYATSDSPPIERCNAALLATTIAEYFRDSGRNVLLYVDSMTRYARALRDVALATGELPARRGYPASVFEQLPMLLERPGQLKHGSITAFYTVLLESEEEADPIGDEIRSILDGHIYLSHKLAGRGHYPAIDILHSISRVFQKVTTPEHRRCAIDLRDMISRLEQIQLYLELGEYQRGESHENDRALDKKEQIEGFLKQAMDEPMNFDNMLSILNELAS
ncbi:MULTISPECIES: type III secretion system ATPase SctN [Providencia]|uniref:protein-secreting ATPase n=1 Tax=Providencia huaxiensis TaxID=2027290 RepID=A0A8I2APH7_9GAMM|nr:MULTISPECIES: type III secretion system ATPase SctN [Providencia]MBN6362980.1 type III secretion system ATPase SctN [Providencia huaxiensis]MBQ0269253.1 type III secretion system ATPase SctN [Providencia huaxiensis]MBQ0533551.1 type III secretion system ATPase SctN [Providencia huaxiensis]MBQ0589046.1 type III secretion system ATPase SctN [Providencia huaxiensis]MDI7239779.1 type III secretion system ATPase SctN [Providencia huaxiensis]